MRIQQFQISLVEKTRRALPRRLKNFEPRSFFSIVKLSYHNPRIHYEVWVRGKERLIEMGLHFESDKQTNDALLAYFDARALEIHAELGPRVEIERRTNAWSRVHLVLLYESLTPALVDSIAQKLARLIVVLQPLVDEFEQGKTSKGAKAQRRG